MTFLNFALALGVTACVIPLVIHLFNRRKFEVIPWGATHLLRPILNTNRRRIRIEQLILLLTRMAILALLAMCMAGPVLTNWRALSGDSKSSLILLLDNSYSMDAGRHAGSHLETAKKHAQQLIRHGRRGSDVSVILMAGGPKDAGLKSATTNRDQTAKEIGELPFGFGGANVSKSLEDAAIAAPQMQHAKRDLVIISDFQARDWSGDSAPQLNRAMEWINSAAIKPTVTLMQVGSEVRDNVSIGSLDIVPKTVATGQPVKIRVNLRNHGEVPYPGIHVHLKVDGKDIAADSVDLGDQEDGQLVFEHVFQQQGSHVVEVAADADSLAADNSMLAVVPVWERLPVLLVDGDPSDEPLKGETAFLKLALSPFLAAADAAPGEDGQRQADLLASSVTTPSGLDWQTLEEKRVLVLANVPRLSDQQVQEVQQFVKDGNSLLIFLGDRVDLDWYQKRMPRELMAAAPVELVSKQVGQPSGLIRPVSLRGAPSGADLGVKISSEQFDHPALHLFNDRRHGNLAEGTVNSWYRLNATGEANVPARLSSGDPLMIENACGDGRVMTFATTCDEAWNNLPARPFYLPLMQQLVTYLATASQPERNLPTGQTIVAHLPSEATTATISRPDGEHTQLSGRTSGKRSILQYAQTAQPGLYTIQAASVPETHFAITAPREESELQLLDDDQLQQVAQSLNGTVVHSADEFLQQDSQRRYGREIWRQVYLLLLVCVVGEILLQQLFSGVLKTAK